MRIAYFADNFYPEISGISDSVSTTGEELRRRGHHVVYVAPYYGKKEHKPAHKYDEQKKLIHDPRGDLPIKRVPSLPYPGSPTGQSRIAVPLGFMLPFMRRFKPDVIHTQAPHGVGLEALYAARALRVPLVGTEHTPVEEFFHYSPKMVANTFGKTWLAWEIWYYNKCVFVTAPYQGLLDDMRTRGLVAPGRGQANPVPFTPVVSTPEEKAACKKQLGLKGPMALCSGRMAPEKRVDTVIRAFGEVLKKIPDATLVLTGHGSSEPMLKKLAEDLKIAPHVQFVGFVSSTEFARLYRAADLYVIMSTAETQSLSLMQAFASGIPAVSASARGLVDYTPSDCGFLVEPGNHHAAAAKMLELLLNDDLRFTMGAAGAQFVKRFTPQKIADDWEQIYTQNSKKK